MHFTTCVSVDWRCSKEAYLGVVSSFAVRQPTSTLIHAAQKARKANTKNISLWSAKRKLKIILAHVSAYEPCNSSLHKGIDKTPVHFFTLRISSSWSSSGGAAGIATQLHFHNLCSPFGPYLRVRCRCGCAGRHIHTLLYLQGWFRGTWIEVKLGYIHRAPNVQFFFIA